MITILLIPLINITLIIEQDSSILIISIKLVILKLILIIVNTTSKTLSTNFPVKHFLRDGFFNNSIYVYDCRKLSIILFKSYNIGTLMLLFLFGAYWVGIALLGVITMLKSFKKYQNYHLVERKPEWAALIRTDAHQWNKTRIILGCVFLAPLRLLVLALYLFIFLIIAFGIWFKGKITPFLGKVLHYYPHYFAYIMKAFVISIQQDFELGPVTTPILICNHVNWFDIFYCDLRFLPLSYIAKAEVAKYPIVGTLGRALNCIFIDRDSDQNRKTAVEQIKKRILDYENKVDGVIPLMIYPEGTTSNGRGILKFKLGAFENLSPITMLCLHYQCQNCGLGQDEVTQLEHLYLLISQFPKLRVQKYIMTPNKGETAQQYMNRTQETMAQKLGYINTSGGYRNKNQLQKLREDESKKGK